MMTHIPTTNPRQTEQAITKPALALVPPIDSQPRSISTSAGWDTFRRAMKAAVLVCSQDSTRSALNSILVESRQNQIHLTTTDGCRLLRISIRVPDSQPVDTFSFQVRRQSAVDWLRVTPTKAKKEQPTVEIRRTMPSGDIEFLTPGNVFKADLVTDHFPPWEQVMPAERSEGDRAAGRVGFCGSYLKDLGTIVGLLGDQLTGGTCVQVGEGPLDPMRADFQSSGLGVSGTYVLMPMRA